MDKILDLIPQRPPIVMVDKFLGLEDNFSRTCLTVRKDNIFVDNGVFSECGVIEHIAQSAAARVGYIFKSKNEAIPLGYIGSVNDFILIENPKLGDKIDTTIEILHEVFNITLIQAHCKVGNKDVASCKMKIFLDNDKA